MQIECFPIKKKDVYKKFLVGCNAQKCKVVFNGRMEITCPVCGGMHSSNISVLVLFRKSSGAQLILVLFTIVLHSVEIITR